MMCSRLLQQIVIVFLQNDNEKCVFISRACDPICKIISIENRCFINFILVVLFIYSIGIEFSVCRDFTVHAKTKTNKATSRNYDRVTIATIYIIKSISKSVIFISWRRSVAITIPLSTTGLAVTLVLFVHLLFYKSVWWNQKKCAKKCMHSKLDGWE